jgi:hypothetical protein
MFFDNILTLVYDSYPFLRFLLHLLIQVTIITITRPNIALCTQDNYAFNA